MARCSQLLYVNNVSEVSNMTGDTGNRKKMIFFLPLTLNSKTLTLQVWQPYPHTYDIVESKEEGYNMSCFFFSDNPVRRSKTAVTSAPFPTFSLLQILHVHILRLWPTRKFPPTSKQVPAAAVCFREDGYRERERERKWSCVSFSNQMSMN